MNEQRGLGRIRLFTFLGAALVVANASAQRMEDFVISADAARLTLNRAEISVDTAERIAKVCVEYAETRDLRAAIFVLGPSGNIVYAYRMDGLNPINVDTALRKAQTVLYMRTTTHAMVNRYGPAMRETMYNLGQFPHTGGLPIMVGDQLIGAIGIGGAGGGSVDEECAYQALTTIIGPQPPLVED